MANCFDVAKYILEKQGQVTAIKLQKLVYYAQAWSLVWDEAPLFEEEIEAWVNGPVVPKLYDSHRGKYVLDAKELVSGNSTCLNKNQKDTIDQVLKYYGDKNSKWLSDLTHLEEPWKKARQGLPADVRGNNKISLADMAEYYSSITAEDSGSV